MRYSVPTLHRPTEAERATAREAARADAATIIERYRARESLARIAADYRVTEPWLRLRFAEWGVPRRPLHESHAHRRPAGHIFRGPPLLLFAAPGPDPRGPGSSETPPPAA